MNLGIRSVYLNALSHTTLMRTTQLDEELHLDLPKYGTKESREFWDKVRFALFFPSKPSMTHRVTLGPCSVSGFCLESSVVD